MIKAFFLSMLIPFIAFCSPSAEQKPKECATSTLDTIKTIETIKIEFKEINSHLGNYKKVQKNVTNRSSEGGELTGYFDGDTLKKISIVDMGEMGRMITEYYLKNGKLFFVYREEQFYDQPIYESESKIVSKKQDRYYLADTNLVQWLNNEKKKVDLSENRCKKEVATFLQEVKEFTKELRDLKD